MISEDLLRRQTGELSRTSLANSLAYRRRLGLELSQGRGIQSAHQGGVTWLDLDHAEQRYLLAGAADASIAVYDTQQAPSWDHGDNGGSTDELQAVLHITKQSPGAHRFSVSSVAWYPVDTGLFVTGGYDNEVKVWDANSLAVAAGFSMSGRVHAVAMSPCATSHCLVAVGSAEPQVMLCDVTSGGFTHTLSGHRAAVWAVHWSLATEWHVMTGGCDGQLRLWDIRRAGPLHVFDQHQTQPAPRPRPRPPDPLRGSSGSGGGGSRAREKNGRGSHSSKGTSNGGSSSRGAGAGAAGGSKTTAGSLGRSSGGGVAGNGRGGSQGAPSERDRMFLPDKVTRYATAHGGSVTGVLPTPHGLNWLSAGTDDCVRLWDAMTYRHLLVNYPGAYNRSLKARQLSASEDSRVLFHPSGSAVQMYDVDTGRPLRVLQGAHYDTINCCTWNPASEELYTGGNDCHIVAWAPPPEATREEEQGEARGADSDGDAWSD